MSAADVRVDDVATQLAKRLDKIRWCQDLARRGQERKEGVTPELSEALRREIRTALEADGNPFDVNVARRVYDLAIAARDMCIAASSTVKEAIDQIKDTNGPMDTLDPPGTPQNQAQVAETFGARALRELLAVLPLLRPQRSESAEDVRQLVLAIADAREHGMPDVAEALETRLLGHPAVLAATPAPALPETSSRFAREVAVCVECSHPLDDHAFGDTPWLSTYPDHPCRGVPGAAPCQCQRWREVSRPLVAEASR